LLLNARRGAKGRDRRSCTPTRRSSPRRRRRRPPLSRCPATHAAAGTESRRRKKEQRERMTRMRTRTRTRSLLLPLLLPYHLLLLGLSAVAPAGAGAGAGAGAHRRFLYPPLFPSARKRPPRARRRRRSSSTTRGRGPCAERGTCRRGARSAATPGTGASRRGPGSPRCRTAPAPWSRSAGSPLRLLEARKRRRR
jgi:hypothetical protein